MLICVHMELPEDMEPDELEGCIADRLSILNARNGDTIYTAGTTVTVAEDESPCSRSSVRKCPACVGTGEDFNEGDPCHECNGTGCLYKRKANAGVGGRLNKQRNEGGA